MEGQLLEESHTVAKMARMKRKRSGSEECEEYEVEEIRAKKVNGRTTKYLVKWKNHQECTWEPSKNLNCYALVEAYEKRDRAQKQRQTTTKRSVVPVQSATEAQVPHAEATDAAIEYEVEAIRDVKGRGRAIKYLVKWRNHADCTWEPRKNLSCQLLIDEFEAAKDATASNSATTLASTEVVDEDRHEERYDIPTETETETEMEAEVPAIQEVEEVQQVQEVQDTIPSCPAPVEQATCESLSEVKCPVIKPARNTTTQRFYCPVCDQSDAGATRRCDRCNTPMHHFCSHAVAQVVGLSDFGDNCYCSVQCFDPSRGDDHAGEPEGEPTAPPAASAAEAHQEERSRAVEWIQDRKYKGKKSQYLVKWKDKDEMTWEKVDDLQHCTTEIRQYEFRRNQLREERVATKPTTEPQCHLCGSQGDLEKRCDQCGNFVHQRCTDQVAMLVGLADFEDESFCSTDCYDAYIVNQLVAFSPDQEIWGYLKSKAKKQTQPKKKYVEVGTAFLVGRICRRKKGKAVGEGETSDPGPAVPLYEVRWLDTAFNSKVEYLDSLTLLRGRKQYQLLDVDDNSDVDGEDDDKDDKDTAQQPSWKRYDARQLSATSLQEVELISSMNFDPKETMKAPEDLYTHEDGTTETRVKAKYKPVFQSSASASFFAYLPVSFWEQVVVDTNAYQKDLGPSYGGYGVQKPFTIDELMTFLGILFYMKLFPRGEYRNFWGAQEENEVLGRGANANLDTVMPLKRFKALRAALCFTHGVSLEELGRDPVAKIRNLVNTMKKTGARYVDVGRNVAIDESTIACRTRYARRLICFNPRKPGGKFHFKIYMMTCATSWIALNYKLYTKDSIAEYRLGGVIPAEDILDFESDIKDCSKIRADVMEILRPLFGTKRIVSTDNYYTSMLLLEGMKLKGLYGRGTVKSGSKHFPKHVMLTKADKCERGDYRIGVCAANQSLAASWWDGNAVTIISNADSSEVASVSRSIRMEKASVEAPVCIREYNKYMQGVDRFDFLLSRFSVADGHSFRKWHKVLAMAFIDIARCNAYLTRKMACGPTKSRDTHRDFLVELTTQLLSGEWKELAPDDSILSDDDPEQSAIFSPGGKSSNVKQQLPTMCRFIPSKQLLEEKGALAKSWKARQCIVCRYEGKKYPPIVTQYCVAHRVCLCSGAHPIPAPKEDCYCPNQEWSCWKKFHEFYLPKLLFNAKGHVRKSSVLYLKKQHLIIERKIGAASDTLPSRLADNATSSPATSSYYGDFSPRSDSTDYGDWTPRPTQRTTRRELNL